MLINELQEFIYANVTGNDTNQALKPPEVVFVMVKIQKPEVKCKK